MNYTNNNIYNIKINIQNNNCSPSNIQISFLNAQVYRLSKINPTMSRGFILI